MEYWITWWGVLSYMVESVELYDGVLDYMVGSVELYDGVLDYMVGSVELYGGECRITWWSVWFHDGVLS